MHVEPSVEAALQECHVQELLEPSPHLNAAMEVGITHPKNKLFGNSTDVYFLSRRGPGRAPGSAQGATAKGPGGLLGRAPGAGSKGARGATSKGARGATADQSQT